MTANQGPGVPAELRERLINVMQFLSLPLGVINDDQACAAIEVDAILAEIAASGHVIVRADTVCLQPATDEVVLSGFNPDDYPVEPGAGR